MLYIVKVSNCVTNSSTYDATNHVSTTMHLHILLSNHIGLEECVDVRFPASSFTQLDLHPSTALPPLVQHLTISIHNPRHGRKRYSDTRKQRERPADSKLQVQSCSEERSKAADHG